VVNYRQITVAGEALSVSETQENKELKFYILCSDIQILFLISK
jgi:hypothetical protein